MPEKIVKKIWGSEEWIVNTDKYCGKILTLKQGFRGSIHHHKNKDETFYILEGEVLMEIGDSSRIMKKGDTQRIKPNVKHRFTGLKNSRIIEFSTHHDDTDTYRDTQSEKINLNEIIKQFNLR